MNIGKLVSWHKRMRSELLSFQIPVFLSKTLTDKLFILQYPSYPKVGYENTTFLKTFIKPESQIISMELGIDTTSQSYDISMGKNFAYHADSKSKKNDDDNDDDDDDEKNSFNR